MDKVKSISGLKSHFSLKCYR